MLYKTKTALAAVATVLVHPFRARMAGDTALASPASVIPAYALPAPRAVHARPHAEAPTDPKAMVEQISANWAAFKTEVEANVGKKADDTLVQAKLGEINADITKLVKAHDEMVQKLAAAQLGGAGAIVDPDVAAHDKAFAGWFRKGNEPSSMRELEVKAKLTTQSDPDGGFLVPTTMEAGIDRVLGTVSAVRSAARVITIGGSEYKRLVSMGGATSGWVGEENERPETDTPVLREIAINTGEIYANPYATQTMLDDAVVDIASWLADEVSIEFAEQEGSAFVLGDGKKKPRGFLNYDKVANKDYGTGKTSAWGKLGFIGTGAANGFKAAGEGADCLMDLYYALKAGYRAGASFMLSDEVMGTVRKMKDGEGNYLWAPPTAEMSATFLGKPTITDDNMPGVNAGEFPIAFGNFQRGYTIIDRQGVRILRDPFTKKPFVGFYTTKRVGGGVTNFEAIKLLKIAA